jgi:hypothetical protein
MMTLVRMNSGITPDPVRSLSRAYERMLGHTTPVVSVCVPIETPGTTS